MKKSVFLFILAAMFVSCQESVEPTNPEESKGTIDISIKGLMGEYTQADAAKASPVYIVLPSWEAGNIVYVYDGAQCLGSLIVSSVIRAKCTGLNADIAITSATLSNVNTTCKLTLSGNAAPAVAGDVKGVYSSSRRAFGRVHGW